MLLEVQVTLRSYRNDGGAVAASEYAALASSPYEITGLDEEDRAAVIAGCSLKLDSFRGRGVSERFFKAVSADIEKFLAFLDSLGEGVFETLRAANIRSDLLFRFVIDENEMDFKFPVTLVNLASRLGLALYVLVDPKATNTG